MNTQHLAYGSVHLTGRPQGRRSLEFNPPAAPYDELTRHLLPGIRKRVNQAREEIQAKVVRS